MNATRLNISSTDLDDVDEEVKRHLAPGHEDMHSAMAFILLATLISSQVGLLYWKRFHSKSFELVGTLGLWAIPPIFGVTSKSWYIIMFVTLMAMLPQEAFQFGILCFFYGVYFGVLGRDTVERISDWMAAAVGYYNKAGLTTKQLRDGVCAICGAPSGDFPDDKIETLACEHPFHEKCIRGWVIVGKKTTCPYCKEKVDTSRFTRGPWETQQVLYLSMLDFVRYLLVWQPIIFGTVNAAFYVLGVSGGSS
ncbi:hypothetical protein HDU93_007847 [Gonapodya sp. JEL0774]|nr:hypothetical protein HDU93_007847 [Gonapodya sp. JEL0774]